MNMVVENLKSLYPKDIFHHMIVPYEFVARYQYRYIIL